MTNEPVDWFEVGGLYRLYKSDIDNSNRFSSNPLRRYFIANAKSTSDVVVTYGTIVVCVGYDNGFPVMLGQNINNNPIQFIVTWSDLRFFEKVCDGE